MPIHDAVPEVTKADTSKRTWQDRLLPLMVLMTVGLTVFFLAASIVQLQALNQAIQERPELDLGDVLESPAAGGSPADAREDLRLRGLFALEANIIERRHHEANVALMARIWTRYMGFITGMTLAMVGAAFILGRLSSESSTLGGGMGKLTVNLQSASPGLFMILLGTILMIVTITNHPRINVVDRAIFVEPVSRQSSSGGAPIEANRPPPLPEWPTGE